MEGKLSKKGAAKDTIKGTKQKIHWEPDHTQIDDVITDEGVPQQGDEPAPHPPLISIGGTERGRKGASRSLPLHGTSTRNYHLIRESVQPSRTLHGTNLRCL
jgi:hypothetical protein